jgi:hypothetical protein
MSQNQSNESINSDLLMDGNDKCNLLKIKWKKTDCSEC